MPSAIDHLFDVALLVASNVRHNNKYHTENKSSSSLKNHYNYHHQLVKEPTGVMRIEEVIYA